MSPQTRYWNLIGVRVGTLISLAQREFLLRKRTIVELLHEENSGQVREKCRQVCIVLDYIKPKALERFG